MTDGTGRQRPFRRQSARRAARCGRAVGRADAAHCARVQLLRDHVRAARRPPGAHAQGAHLHPGAEIPFAGHPYIGTAFVLAAIGTLAAGADTLQVVIEEGAGPVPVAIRYRDGQPVYCELTAPQAPTLGATPPVGAVAASLGLSPDTVPTSTHPPRVASAGLPFLLVELRGRTALAAARVRHDEHAALLRSCGGDGLHLYTRDSGAPGVDLQARMYAPLHGVAEDPATGSANVALAGLLAACAPEADGAFAWRIAQGVEMGRPSLLEASAIKRGGAVETVRIGGRSVLVCDGWIEVGDATG